MKNQKVQEKLQEIKEKSLSLAEIQPIIIKIKNNTDEKLFDVPVFNHDFEKQDKIRYENGITGMNYGGLLNYYHNIDGTIVLMRMIAFCEHQSFLRKQVNSHINWTKKEWFGNAITQAHHIYYDAYQNITSVVDSKEVSLLINHKTNLVLPFLMPEMDVRIYLWIKENK